jgi:immune inhibitor A
VLFGVCAISFLLVLSRPSEAYVPARGELRLLAIRAAFQDRALEYDAEHFAGTPASLVDRMVDYYAEVSTGRLRIVPTLGTAVVTLPEARARYVQRSPTLASDAIREFARVAGDADRAALARAHAVVVFFPGPGRESWMKPGDSGDPWSNYVELAPPVEGIATAMVVAADQREGLDSLGVLCHEFGHALGLPELYAPGAAVHEGIGKWGLMGQGTWVGRGRKPPHMEAWSKVQLGWVDVVDIDRPTIGLRLPAVTDQPLVARIPAVTGKPKEYYLLENRMRAGHDEAIPGEGILVWHVDESVTGFRTSQANARHKLLHLVEADGRGDLDRGTSAGGNRGDDTDPWRGPPRWRRVSGSLLALFGALYVAIAVYRLVRARSVVRSLLSIVIGTGALVGGAWLRSGPVCGPGTLGMAPYGGEPVRVVLRNFSPSGPVMTADMLVAPADVAPSEKP